jgi:hypothetical protein
MEIIKRQIILSIREKVEFLEIRLGHRLSYYSYTYRINDKYGKNRPIVRWDNFGGQIHFETYDLNGHIFKQQKCDYKNMKEILNLVKIFKNNLAVMDISQL